MGVDYELLRWPAIPASKFSKPFGLLSAGGDVAGLMAAVQRYSRYGAIVGVYPERRLRLLEISKLIPMLVLRYDFSLEGGPGKEWTLLNDWFVRQGEYRVRVSRRGGGRGGEGRWCLCMNT